jgi:hypothetical protein
VRNLADPIWIDSSNPEDPMARLAVVLLALFGQMERTYTLERAAHARAVATAKGRRASAGSRKGGHIHLLHFQTAAARLLRNLTAERETGPVFLTVRRAASHRVTAAADLDPGSGRARLSYEMAEQLFKEHSGGATLHRLQHSRLTHLGDQNVSAPPADGHLATGSSPASWGSPSPSCSASSSCLA